MNFATHEGPRPAGNLPTKIQRSGLDRTSQDRSASRSVHPAMGSPGKSLDSDTRDFFEPRFGFDFSRVRVHADSRAASSARAINAQAYTAGNDVVFDEGRYAPDSVEGRQLLAHELMHVVQQDAGARAVGPLATGSRHDGFEQEADAAARHSVLGGSTTGVLSGRSGGQAPALQKYEASEHAQFGETGDILKAISDRAFAYKVKAGEMPKQIAAKFGITESELVAANKAKMKKWPSNKDPRKKVQGFNAGDEIVIPPLMNEAIKEALKTKEMTLMVNGVSLSYGEGIAMGDLFESPEKMMQAPAGQLMQIQDLIKKDKPAGSVKPEQWKKVVPNYLDLAEKNEAHFAPSNSSAPVSGKSTANNKSAWETNHTDALHFSQGGDKDKAMATNAFADHFLTDAFSAGHLINKADVMQKFESNLPRTATGDFAATSTRFFDEVARNAFTGPVQTEFSRLQTVDCYSILGNKESCRDLTSVHARINSVDRFSTLLQGIHQEKPDLFENVVVKGVHDTLNTAPGGVPVENAKGDKWNLSGDKTLNKESLEIGKKAVAQSQFNVLDSFKLIGALDLPALFRKVWDYVPFPRKGSGDVAVKNAVESGTDPKSKGLVGAAVDLISNNLGMIVDKLINTYHKLERA
jgi:hypothetical protein